MIGYNALLQNSLREIQHLEQYDFVMVLRIDIYLKEQFLETCNPNENCILFPSICFLPHHICRRHPRINDMMLFIPKKYYRYIPHLRMNHDCWAHLMEHTDLTYDDLDTMVHTYHDSDSAKDYNPLYYIVNRPQCTHWHSKDHIFEKHTFRK